MTHTEKIICAIIAVIAVCLIAGAAWAKTDITLSCDHCEKAIDPSNYSRYHYVMYQVEANSGSVPNKISDDVRFCGKPCALDWLLDDRGEKLRESWTLPPKGKGVSFRYACASCGYVKWESCLREKMFCGQCGQDKKTQIMGYTGQYDEADVRWVWSHVPRHETDDSTYEFQYLNLTP